MRFASIGASNASNYAAAGQAVVNQTGKINKAAIESGVDFGKLAIDGMKARSYEKQAAMSAEAHVAKAGLRAAASVQKSAIKADAKVASDKSKIKTQMAGRVAAMGGIMAKGLSGSKSKRPVAPATYDLSGMMKDYDETIAKYTKKAADIRSSIPQSKEVATNSQGTGVTDNGSTIQDSPSGAVTGSTNTSATGSNFFTTGSTGIGTGPHLDARVWSHKAGGWVKPTGLYEQYITGPDGQSLSDYGMSSGYGPRTAPTAGASTFHVGEDWLTPSGTRLSINLPQVEGHHGRKFDSGGGWMSGYRINDDLELHLMHGQQLATDRV